MNKFSVFFTCFLLIFSYSHSQTAPSVDFDIIKLDENGDTLDGLNVCTPTQIIVINRTTGTEPITYRIDNGKGEGVREFVWQNGEGLFSYSDRGTYDFTVTAENSAGTDNMTQTIRAFGSPEVAITVDNSEGCSPLPVTFSDNTTLGEPDAPIVNFYWDFRDNTRDSLNRHSSKTFSVPNNYDIYFEVIDANGCKGWADSLNFVKVYSQPIIDFQFTSDFQACEPPLTVSVENTTTWDYLPLTFEWTYGEDQSLQTGYDLPDYSYMNEGNYPVSLTAEASPNCYAQSDVTRYVTLQNTIANFEILYNGNTIQDGGVVCGGIVNFAVANTGEQYSTFTITDADDAYVYSFTTSTSRSYNFTEAGTYTIHQEAGINCPDEMTKTIIVDIIDPGFTINQYHCPYPITIVLEDTTHNSVISEWKKFDADDDSYFFQNQSNNSVEIVYSEYPSPDSLLRTEFSDNKSPMLVATTALGCKDSIVLVPYVSFPTSRFTIDSSYACTGSEITFFNIDTRNNENSPEIIQYEWVFGDGNRLNGNEDTVEYAYNQSGEYKPYLIITDEYGCKDTSIMLDIRIGEHYDFDVANNVIFDPIPSCYNDSLGITVTIQPDFGIDTWRIRSENASLRWSEQHNSSQLLAIDSISGINPIDAEVIVSHNGCTTSSGIEAAAFDYDGIIANFSYRFDCDSSLTYFYTIRISNATEYSLDFGDNTDTVFSSTGMDTSFTFIHTYPEAGDYNFTLTALNSAFVTCNSYDTTYTIKVRTVDAKISMQPHTTEVEPGDTMLCLGIPYLFYSDSSVSYKNDCYHEGFLWYWGDGSVPNRTYQTLQAHAFNQEGRYLVRLQVTDDNGCTDWDSIHINVVQPEASYSTNIDEGCPPQVDVQFSTPLLDTTIQSWLWDFADGNIMPGTRTGVFSSMDTVTHTFVNTSGHTYVTSLIVFDRWGCSDIETLPVFMFKPDAQYSVSSRELCTGETTLFTAFDTDIDSVIWTLGNGLDTTIYGDNTLNYAYSDEGRYQTELRMYKGPCSDSLFDIDIDTSLIVQKANAEFRTSSDVIGCYKDFVTFTHLYSEGPFIERNFYFDERDNMVINENFTDDSIIRYPYTSPGAFRPSLELTTTFGCQDSYTLDSLVVNGPVADFQVNPSIACNGDIINFNITDSANVSRFRWIFNDGYTDSISPANHRYSTLGSISPTLWIYNYYEKDGEIEECAIAIEKEDLIYIHEVDADFETPNVTDYICKNDTLYFSHDSTGKNITNWEWDFGDSRTSSELNPEGIIYTEPGTYEIKLMVYNNTLTCRDTMRRTIEVLELPSISINAEDSICRDSSIALNAIYDSQNNIVWFIDSLNSGSSNPYVDSPIENTTYTAYVTDDNECHNADTLNLYVYQYPEHAFITYDTLYPETERNEYESIYDQVDNFEVSIINGEPQLMEFTSNYPSTFTWDNYKYLNCTDCTNPITVSIDDLTSNINHVYEVEIKDQCFTNLYTVDLNILAESKIDIPDAFTPNGDGSNDKLRIRGWGIKEIEYFNIYNRLGQLVYQSTDLYDGWDGTFKGKDQGIGTFTYKAKVVSFTGKETILMGHFNLLR